MMNFSFRLHTTLAVSITAAVLLWILTGCTPTTAAPQPAATRPSGVLNPVIPTKVMTRQPTLTAEPQVTFTPIPTLNPTHSPTPTPSPSISISNSISIPTPNMPAVLPIPTDTISQTVHVPILMYHYISHPPAGADKYRIDLSVTPENFYDQMRYLAENGYTTIDFYELLLAFSGQQPLPPNPVILTFDDGYVDNYEYAFPILEEFGLKATFFIITEYVDFGNPNHMSWPMIEELAAAGHRIESHSKTHPNLTELDWDEQLYQLLGSQETLAAHLGYTPRFFCFPGGRYNEETLILLQELGYWGAVTTQRGSEHSFANRYEWQRIRIRHNTYLPEFSALLRPSVDATQ